jgi:hypothetical protein
MRFSHARGFLLVLTLILSSCDDDYMALIRNAVAENGSVDRANSALLWRAARVGARDAYIYSRFLHYYVPQPPGAEFESWRFKTERDQLALLNCSAEAGLAEAQRDARYAFSSNTQVLVRLDSRGFGGSAVWRSCGAVRLLPPCPL